MNTAELGIAGPAPSIVQAPIQAATTAPPAPAPAPSPAPTAPPAPAPAPAPSPSTAAKP